MLAITHKDNTTISRGGIYDNMDFHFIIDPTPVERCDYLEFSYSDDHKGVSGIFLVPHGTDEEEYPDFLCYALEYEHSS